MTGARWTDGEAAGLLSHLLGSVMSPHRFAAMMCRPFGIAATVAAPPYDLEVQTPHGLEEQPFQLDGQTPCEAFSGILGFWLFAVLPSALLAISLIARIVASRR